MKKIKLTRNNKILLSVLLVLLLSVTMLGVSSIFADPTIEQLFPPQSLGEFQPNEWVEDYTLKDLDLQPVDLVHNTTLLYSNKLWTDKNEDGEVNSLDVFAQENFEIDTFMSTTLLPVFKYSDTANALIIDLHHLNKDNAVVAEVNIGPKNESGETFGKSSYYYDKETQLLYVDASRFDTTTVNEKERATVDNDKAENRIEVISIVKDVPTHTIPIDVFTLVGKDVKDPDNVIPHLINGTQQFNIGEWDAGSAIEFKLTDEDHVAYLSKENIDVFVNAKKADRKLWAYEAPTGKLKISCTPHDTREIVVKINALNEVDKESVALQSAQAKMDGGVLAVDLEQVVTDSNYFMHGKPLEYNNVEPKVGDSMVTVNGISPFNISYVISNSRGELTTAGSGPIWSSQHPAHKALTRFMDENRNKMVNNKGKKVFKTSTIYATDWVAALEDPTYGYIKDPNLAHKDEVYGEVVGNLLYAQKYAPTNDVQTSIDTLLQICQGKLFDDVMGHGTNGYGSETTFYKMANVWYGVLPDSAGGTANSIHIIYPKDPEQPFLGGIIPDDVLPMFEVSCARISDSSLGSKLKGILEEKGDISTNTYAMTQINATIVKKTEPDNNGEGFIYVALNSDSIMKGDIDKAEHSQRLLCFSKIPYKFNGTGKIQLGKFCERDTNKMLAGAKYGIYKDEDCKQYVGEIVTQNRYVQSIDLRAGTYYLKELTPPTGYNLSNAIYRVDVVGGKKDCMPSAMKVNGKWQNISKVIDERQPANITLTVYDETTKNNQVKVPVPGVSFSICTVKNNSVVSTQKTDAKGQVHFTVDTLDGPHYIKQNATVTNYAMNDKCHERIPIDSSPDTSGKDKNFNLVHWEPRQEVTLEAHVQDINLKGDTPAELGGTAEGYVATLNAKYKIKNTTEILLGYTTNGQAIKLPANTILTVRDSKDPSNPKSAELVVSKAKKVGGRPLAYLTVNAIAYQGKEFKVPNGQYLWQMAEASPGYKTEGVTFKQDASWNKNNVKPLVTSKGVVTEKRLPAQIDLYVKGYGETDIDVPRVQENMSIDIFNGTLHTNNVKRMEINLIKNGFAPIGNRDGLMKNFTKNVYSNNHTITKDSVETSNTLRANQEVIRVKSNVNKKIQNSIYEIQNICDIVDEKTGSVIPANSLLGFYFVDQNGHLVISRIGTNEIDLSQYNFVDDFGNKLYKINNQYPMTKNNKTVVNGMLPNGLYKIQQYRLEEKIQYFNRLYIENDLVTLNWTTKDATKGTLAKQALSLIQIETMKPDITGLIPLAPDVPGSEEYNPDLPNPDGSKDTPEDIPMTNIDWIYENQHNKLYRMIDTENVINNIYEVEDKLPATFSFYLQRESARDEFVSFVDHLSFYYEIPREEYPDHFLNTPDPTGEYVQKKSSGKYFRRFKTDALSGGVQLTDVITLNPKNDPNSGYLNYHQIKGEDLPVAGAVHNYKWLNDRLRQTKDGTYQIMVQIETDMTIDLNTTTHDTVTYKGANKASGLLTFVNRQMVNLD